MKSSIITGGNGTDLSGGTSPLFVSDRVKTGHYGSAPLKRSPCNPSPLDRRAQLKAGSLASRSLPAWMVLLALLVNLQLLGQTVSNEPVQIGNRYLLILNTSRGMKSRAEATVKAIHDLLTSGMRGQLERGDTVGVWSFNEELYTGQLPLQRWSAEAEPAVTSNVLAFLRRQRYEKQARVEKLLPAVSRLIKGSEGITIILVSDGNTAIRGIGFDDRINRLYDLWRDEQQRARQPILTVWRAERGKVVACSVTPSPWPVELPPVQARPLPIPAPTTQAPAPAAPKHAVALPQKTPAPTAPPIIISGKKPEAPRQPAETNPAPVTPRVEAAAKPAEPMRQTNAPAANLVQTAPAIAAKAEPASPLPTSPAPPPAVVPSPAKPEPVPAAVVTDPKPTPTTVAPPTPLVSQVKPAEPPAVTPPPIPPPVKAEPVPTVVAPEVKSPPATVPAPTPPAKQVDPAEQPTKAQPVPTVAVPAPMSSSAAVTAPAPPANQVKPAGPVSSAPPSTTAEPAPAAAEAAPKAPRETSPSTPAMKPVETTVETPSTPPAEATPNPAPEQAEPSAFVDTKSATPQVTGDRTVGVSSPAQAGWRVLWISAILLAFVVTVAGFFFLRRSRSAPRGSLITRSLDPGKKP